MSTFNIVTTRDDETRRERAERYAEHHRATVTPISQLKWDLIHGATESVRKHAYDRLNRSYYQMRRT